MTPTLVIRFPFALGRADMQALRRLEEEFDETPAAGRIGPEAEVQVRTASGEIYNLEALPKFRTRRLRNGNRDPQPPAGAAALRRVA